MSNVEAGSAAEDAGLRRGDLIKEVDHKQVTTVDDFAAVISHTAHDGTVLLLVQRGNNTFFAAIQLP